VPEFSAAGKEAVFLKAESTRSLFRPDADYKEIKPSSTL
jgi:hypothetical protein